MIQSYDPNRESVGTPIHTSRIGLGTWVGASEEIVGKALSDAGPQRA
jgi:hypothetical protein